MEKKVLFIDDEASLRRSVSFGLMQRGYDIEPCENGMRALQALEMYKKKQVPLHYVVIDVRLPDIDGIKLLKVIKFNYPELPVVVITGFGNESVAQEAKMEKADAYLEKPFSIDELLETIEGIPGTAVQPEPAVQPAALEKKSVSAYVLINFAAEADLAQAYNNLSFMDNVLYCDATKGETDVVLLLQAEEMSLLHELVEKKIKTLAGVTGISFLPVEVPLLPEAVQDVIGTVDKALGRDKGENEVSANRNFWSSASSYVFLEIEKEKLDSIYPALYLNDQVIYCDCLRGKYDIALMMQGASYADIDNAIQTKIKPLAGVLRIKELPIIKLYEM